MLTQNKWKYTSFCHSNVFYILNTNRWNKRFAPSSTWSSIWLNWPFDFNVWCPLHVWDFRVRYILRFVYSFNQSRKGSSFGPLKCNIHHHHKSPACKYSILSKLIETSFFNFEYFISKPKKNSWNILKAHWNRFLCVWDLVGWISSFFFYLKIPAHSEKKPNKLITY